MTNKLLRDGYSYTIPAVPPTPARPAYSYFVTETIQLPASGAPGAAPAGWGYRQVNVAQPGQPPRYEYQLVYLGTLSGGGVTTDVPPSAGGTTVTRTRRIDVPADPGAPGSPAAKVEQPPAGWNSFAHSLTSVPGAGYGTFNVAAKANAVVVGLAPFASPVAGYSHIAHGLHFTGGRAQNLRSGADYGAYGEADLFKVQVKKDVVNFYKNGTLIGSDNTSITPPQTLFLSAAMYGPGDYVNNPAVTAENDGGGATSFAPLVVSGGNNINGGTPKFGALYVISPAASGGSPRFAALSVFGSDASQTGGGSTTLSPLNVLAYGGALDVVGVSGGDTSFSALLGAGLLLVGQTGGGNTSFKPLAVYGSETSYGAGATSFAPLYVVSFPEPEDEGYLVETFNTSVTLTPTSEVVAVMISGVLATTTMIGSQTLEAFMQEVITATPSWATQTVVEALMMSFVHAGAVALPDGVGGETWVVNVDSSGSTSYSGYGFNSYARLGDKYLGANDSGIYLLEGDTDAGAPIRASIHMGKRDGGSSVKKTWEQCYLGMSSKGNLFLKVTAEGKTYVYKTRSFSSELQEQRITMGKGLRTNYVELELYNENGADFELDTVRFMVADLTRSI